MVLEFSNITDKKHHNNLLNLKLQGKKTLVQNLAFQNNYFSF